MQTTGSSDNSKPTGAPPPEDAARDEDSGLHDIRSMASSTKMRLSSKRITTNPPVDDDILSSSSGSWKAVALPEPAKMVSLPEIDQDEPAPSSERKSKKELKAERTSASKIAKEAIAVETSASMPAMGSPAPAMKPDLATPVIGARFAQPQKKSKSGLYAMLGVGLAAAAGVGWYVSTQMDSSKESASSNNLVAANEEQAERHAAAQTAAPVAAPAAGSATVTAIVEPTPPADPKADEGAVATGMSAGAAAPGADEAKAADTAKRPAAKGGKADKADKKREEAAKPAPVEKKITTEQPKDSTKTDGKKKDGETEGEPSFDALLKEAGVQDKKPEKVALEKKSLSGADIKKGMSSVASKAQACYAGQQGTAQVKLTVAPDGTVQKVAVTGVFAGTPVGACVASAVKSATFPAWEGGPQSFGYSYLLAE